MESFSERRCWIARSLIFLVPWFMTGSFDKDFGRPWKLISATHCHDIFCFSIKVDGHLRYIVWTIMRTSPRKKLCEKSSIFSYFLGCPGYLIYFLCRLCNFPCVVIIYKGVPEFWSFGSYSEPELTAEKSETCFSFWNGWSPVAIYRSNLLSHGDRCLSV